MSSTQEAIAIGRPMPARRVWRPTWPGGWLSSESSWAVAFMVPYAAVFLAFVVYPVAFALWIGSSPDLYAELFSNPRYPTIVINTLLLAGVGVNLKMFLAFLLSGFFMLPGR